MCFSIPNESGDIMRMQQRVGEDLWGRESAINIRWRDLGFVERGAYARSAIAVADWEICSRCLSSKVMTTCSPRSELA